MIISEKLCHMAERKVANKIKELSVEFKQFVDSNNLKEDMPFVAEVTAISEDDLNDFYSNSPDCDMNPYSLNLYYMMYYLLFKIDRNKLLNEIKEEKAKWEDDSEDEEQEFIEAMRKADEEALPKNNNVDVEVTSSSFKKSQTDNDGNKTIDSHASIKGIDNSTGRVIETNASTIEDASREFIKKINEALGNKNAINLDEAMNAKKVFDKDINNNIKCDYENPVKDKVSADYEKSLQEAQLALFGDTEMLDKKSIGTLRYYIFKNGWDKEFDHELLNHRQSVLLFLYRKLQESMEERLKAKNNITADDMKNFEKSKKVANNEYKKQMNSVKDKSNNFNNPEVKMVSLDDIFKLFSDFFKK